MAAASHAVLGGQVTRNGPEALVPGHQPGHLASALPFSAREATAASSPLRRGATEHRFAAHPGKWGGGVPDAASASPRPDPRPPCPHICPARATVHAVPVLGATLGLHTRRPCEAAALAASTGDRRAAAQPRSRARGLDRRARNMRRGRQWAQRTRAGPDPACLSLPRLRTSAFASLSCGFSVTSGAGGAWEGGAQPVTGFGQQVLAVLWCGTNRPSPPVSPSL